MFCVFAINGRRSIKTKRARKTGAAERATTPRKRGYEQRGCGKNVGGTTTARKRVARKVAEEKSKGEKSKSFKRLVS